MKCISHNGRLDLTNAVFDTTTDSVELTGTGALTMSGPTSGNFKGVTIFADRNNINTSKISGNGSGFGGTIYLKSGRLQLTGNGNGMASKIVVDTLTIGGTGSLTITVP